MSNGVPALLALEPGEVPLVELLLTVVVVAGELVGFDEPHAAAANASAAPALANTNIALRRLCTNMAASPGSNGPCHIRAQRRKCH